MKAKTAVHKRVNVPKLRLDPCSQCGADRMINGRWLQVQRERAGLTIQDVADRLGLARSFLSAVEHNHRTCKPHVLAFYERLAISQELTR